MRRSVLWAALLATACGGGDDGAQREPGEGEAAAPAGACAGDNGGLVLPTGLCATVFADSVIGARHMAVSANGVVYVRAQRDTLGGGLIALRDTDGDGRADERQRFEASRGTGAAIHEGYLYFSTDTTVLRVALPTDGTLVPTAPVETIVHGFPRQRSHSAKPFTFDGAGNLYVTVGGPSNACQPQDRQPGVPGEDPCGQYELQTAVWRFAANRPNQLQTDGTPYAVGIRNAMAIDWNAGVGALYVVQHGRDQLDVIDPEHFTQEDNATKPGELFYRLAEGDSLHHPYCFWDLDQQQAVLSPEYGGDGQEIGRCDQYKAPIAAYPAHWGPNDLLFYAGTLLPEQYRGGAFIAFHGSWNRAPLPMGGYIVAYQPMENGAPVGDYQVFADGFTGQPEISSPGEAAYRPTGLAMGPDGALFISDDTKGRIWRVVPR